MHHNEQDTRSLALHVAAVALMRSNETLIQQALDVLERWDLQASERSKQLRDEWVRILGERDWVSALAQNERGNELRQASPVTCLLPNYQRFQIIRETSKNPDSVPSDEIMAAAGAKQIRIQALRTLAIAEAKELGLQGPRSSDPHDLADSLHRTGDVLFIAGDPNLDNVKRNIAIQVFLEFSFEEMVAFGTTWLKKWARNSGESWYQEWSEIIERGSATELQEILLSAAPDQVRQRSSMPFAEMLGFDGVLAIKRR